MIRHFHPTDIAALLLFLGKSPVNEAKTRDRLSGGWDGLMTIVPLLKGYLFERKRRHNLVYVNSGHIRGLLAVRSRNGPNAWEIERLLLARGQEKACLDLLERSGSLAGEIGAEKIFLRLNYSSPLLDVAREASFCHYLTESLYCLEQVPKFEPHQVPSISRPKLGTDELGLFRLYGAAVPPKVRSAEGLTLQEWCQSRDRDANRELIFEKEGEISAWLKIRLNGRIRQIDVLISKEAADMDKLVNCSLAVVSGKGPIYWLVPEFQQCLRDILEEQGFRHVAEYCCLSKQLAVRISEPQLVPLRA